MKRVFNLILLSINIINKDDGKNDNLAAGFRIDILDDITSIKSSLNKSYSLLDYIVEEFARLWPESLRPLYDFYQKYKPFTLSTNIQEFDLIYQMIIKGIDELFEISSSIKIEDSCLSQNILILNREIIDLKGSLKNTGHRFNIKKERLSMYFGCKSHSSQKILSLLLDFLAKINFSKYIS